VKESEMLWKYYVLIYESGKMRPVESLSKTWDKGDNRKWWRG
jgi:hypothetical protein